MTIPYLFALMIAVGLAAYFMWKELQYRDAIERLRRQLETGKGLSSRVKELETILGPMREKLESLQEAQSELQDLRLQSEMNQWLLNAFGSEEDSETILEEGLAISTKWFKADAVIYLKYETEQHGFVFSVARGKGVQEWMRALRMSVSTTPFLMQRIYSTRDPIIFRKEDEDAKVLFGEGVSGNALAGVVRRSGNQYGLLVAYTRDEITAESPVFARFEQFVHHLSTYLDHARIAREMNRHLRDLEAIHQVHLQIGSMRDYHDVLNASVEAVARAVGIEIGMLELLEDQDLVLTACFGIDNWQNSEFVRLKVGESLSGWVAEHDQVLAVEDMEKDPRFIFKEAARKLGLKSYIGAPIRVAGRLIGVLSAVSLSPRQFTSSDIELMNTLAGSLGVYIEQTRTYQHLEAQLWNLERQNTNLKKYVDDLETSYRGARQFEYSKSEIQSSLIRDLRETFTVLAGAAGSTGKEASSAQSEEVNRWVQQARRTLNQLQEVTRVHPGSFSLDLVRADPVEVLLGVLRETSQSVQASGIRFQKEIQLPEGTIQARIDRGKLEEAISGVFRYLQKATGPPYAVNALLDWYVPEQKDAPSIVGGSYIRLRGEAHFQEAAHSPSKPGAQSRASIPADLFLARSLLEMQGGKLEFEAEENLLRVTLWIPATLEKTQEEAVPSPTQPVSEGAGPISRMTAYIYAPEPNPAFTEFLVRHTQNWSVTEFKGRDDLFQRCRVAPPDTLFYYGVITPELLKLYSSLNQILPYSIPFLAVNPQFTRILGTSRLTDALFLNISGAPAFRFESILRHIPSPATLQSLLKTSRSFPLIIIYDFPISDQITRSLNELLQYGSVVLLGDSESHQRVERVVESIWTLPV